MKIRTFNHEDSDSVLALWRDVFAYGALHNDPAESLRRKIEVDHNLLFIAETDGEIVGTLMAGYDGHRGWIYSVAVAESKRKEGVGSALMKRAEEALTELGCPKINLQIRSENDQVTSFYERLGYVVEPRVSMGKILVT